VSSQTVSLISILLALAAVCVAAWQVRAGARGTQKQNSLPVVSEVFIQWRSPDFSAALQRLLKLTEDELSCECFEVLSADRRRDAYEVCYFFDYLGALIVFEIIDEDIILAVMANRLMQVWIAMRQLIANERSFRLRTYSENTPPGFLIYYEHLVKRTVDLGGKDAAEKLRRRREVLRLAPNDMPSENPDQGAAREILAFGNAVKNRRVVLGLSITDLAHRAGMTADEIERIEDGGTQLDIALLRRLAAALDADVRLMARGDLGSMCFEAHTA